MTGVEGLGQCPECGRNGRLTRSGRITKHGKCSRASARPVAEADARAGTSLQRLLEAKGVAPTLARRPGLKLEDLPVRVSYAEVLRVSGNPVQTKFVGWARSDVTLLEARAQCRGRSTASLERTRADLARIPGLLVNQYVKMRLAVVTRELSQRRDVAELRSADRLARARPAPTHIRSVVSAGLPTMGNR